MSRSESQGKEGSGRGASVGECRGDCEEGPG